MRLLDSRRLTGANLFMDHPGAVIDVAVTEDERDLLAATWRHFARHLLDDMGWPLDALVVREFEGGLSLALAAPEDGLYTATELNEAAWEAARDQIEGGRRHLLRRVCRGLRAEYRDEERPRLQRLLDAAHRRGTAVLLDEEQLTLGTGRFAQTWDLYELPHPDDVDWPACKAVPTALVTGTNGKTTTVRLLAAIARQAGKTAGVSSTDWLAMGDELIERSDFAGPGGARRVLRDERCEVAILETARGGILRRGLALPSADVALITNIAADHLGDFGIKTVDDLADVKWTVSRALGSDGALVLNAEDPLLMARAGNFEGRLVLFSLNPRAAEFSRHVESGGRGYTLQRGRLTRISRGERSAIIRVADIPLSFGGKARHNVANALAATAVAEAMGFSQADIVAGLKALGNDDNPGRANLYTVKGATFLVDFAHNPAGLEALMPLVGSLPAQRRMLVTGQAGDREDTDLRDFAAAASPVRFDRIILKRMDGHARGRAVGEVAKIMREAFLEQGYQAREIRECATEIDALKAALRWAGEGDLVVFLSHEKRDLTREYIEARADKDTQ